MNKKIKEITKYEAIDKLVEVKMNLLLNNLNEFENVLKYGFEGFYDYSDYTLELLLRDRINEDVIWRIV